jgi:hypothetical protein
MNTRPAAAVKPRVSRSFVVILIAASAATASAGCVEVNGGAVELSWALRDFDGQPNDCESSGIEQIRICWSPLGDAGPPGPLSCQVDRPDGGVERLYRAFDCEQNRGVTRFEVPPGTTALFVSPLCGGSQDPTGRVEVPAPIVRTVVEGEVVTLDQILIVASNEDCVGDQCTCPP